MNQAPLLEMQLRGLHLSGMLANYQRLLKNHAEPLPYLTDLVSLETTKRQENGVRARIATAHFPTTKTIEAFDFSLQPELPKAKILEHFDGSFVEKHRNLIWLNMDSKEVHDAQQAGATRMEISEVKSALPRRRTLCTNSKKDK
jgi:hypothetical protein